MDDLEPLDPRSTALVLIDLQLGITAGDVMAARDEVLHTHSVTRIFPTLGRVRTSDVVLAALGAGR